MPKDKIQRVVVSDGNKVYMYKVVGTKLEAEWSMSVRLRGQVFSVYLVDLGRRRRVRGDRQATTRRAGSIPSSWASRTASRAYLEDSIEEFLFAVDAKGEGYKQTVWTQRFSRGSFSPRARPSRWRGRTASS
jgi:hypothetical protein